MQESVYDKTTVSSRVSLRSPTVTQVKPKVYLDGSPLPASGLGDIDDGHAGLGESGAVVLQPEHVGGLAALGRVRVLRGLFEYGRIQNKEGGKNLNSKRWVPSWRAWSSS